MRTTFAATGATTPTYKDDTDAATRLALFLDVDGTLLDLAERPDDVTIPAGLLSDVAAARARTAGALALVSGRLIADLDRLFAPLRLPAAGVHGAELRLDPAGETRPAPEADSLPLVLWTAVNGVLQDFPGTFVEDKRYSYAVHYRQAPAAGDALRARLRSLVEDLPHPGITMLDAHCAFELKLRQFDKGRAIAALLATPPFRDRTPIFIGDDDTDEAGFAAVSAVGGRAYSVGRRRPGVVGVFESPSDVRGWLAAFAAGSASA